MTDFEMLAMLLKKAHTDISDWITLENEEEIEVFFGTEGESGFSFFFNKKTGMVERGDW